MLEPVMGTMYTRLFVAVALVFGFFSCTSRWDEEVAGEIRARLTGATTAEGVVVFPVSGDLHAPDSLRAFYKDRKFRPLWITRDGASTQALALFATLESAEADGLAPEDLHLQALNRLFAEPEARSRAARLDILLTDGLIVYANELVNGRIDPVSIDAECLRTPEPLDVQLILNRIAGGENMADLLASLAPADPGYALLRKAHRRYLGIAARGGWSELSPDAAETAVRGRLQAEGYLSEGDESEDALREFQRSHGLRDDGVLNEATLAALNVPAAARAEQITLNLERWRWLPRELGMPRVVVNIAGFSLEALAPEEEPLTMRTIVGISQRRTPVMSGEINTLVLNPTWGIPPTILKEDLLPKLKADPSYLTRHETRVFDTAIGAEVDPTSIAWDELNPESIPYVLRQDGGPSNPLGQI
ncbi:MAG: L,D-transpeptidase family protein, partial [Chrysiogenetes bacterium]|nr:L,D-transpeptidase family protein [Chrysiogenetes bacterium]